MISSGKKEELALVFDVGSGSVGAALVTLSKTPKIVFTTRAPISFGEAFNFDAFLFGMTKALSEVADAALSAKLGAPDKIFCFLASPWQASQTRIIKMSRKIPFTVTNKLVAELAEKEINTFGSSVASLKSLSEGSALLESEIMDIKLNGYKTLNPFERKATELELALYLSISPERVLESLRFNIQKFFNRDVRFFSFPFSAFAVARDIYPAGKDFLFTDIAGEITDVALVRDDVLEESISFPLGRNSFVRVISQDLSKSLPEAVALFDIFLSGRAEPKISDSIAKILQRPAKDWLAMFQESLSQISNKNSLPARIYLTADPDAAFFFSYMVGREEMHQFTAAPAKFDVIILESKVLAPFCALGAQVEADPFLMLQAIFINKKL